MKGPPAPVTGRTRRVARATAAPLFFGAPYADTPKRPDERVRLPLPGDAVPLRTDAYYRDIADRALVRAGISEPPVTLEQLAEALGLPVLWVNLPDFFSGAVINQDGMPVFVVNARIWEPDRRSTLAHLIAHVLLVLEEPGATYPRNTATQHAEADALAHELLLPASLVVAQSKLWFNDHRYLSRLFGVTEHQMLERMKELGLIKGTELLWDF